MASAHAQAFRQRSMLSTVKVGPMQDQHPWQAYKEKTHRDDLRVKGKVKRMYWAIAPILVFMAPFGFDFFYKDPNSRCESTRRKTFTIIGYLLKSLFAGAYILSLFVLIDRMAGIINIRWISHGKFSTFKSGEITVATVALQLISYLMATVNFLFLIHKETRIRNVICETITLAAQRVDDDRFKSLYRKLILWTILLVLLILGHLGAASYASANDVFRGYLMKYIKDVESNSTIIFNTQDLYYVRATTLLFSRFIIYPFKDCLVCLFCLVCIVARFCFVHLVTPRDTRITPGSGSRQPQGEVSELQGRHYKTSAAVTAINDCFAFMVFLWISLGAIDICSVSKLLCDARAGSGPLAQMMIIGLVATIYITKLILSSSLNTEVSESLSDIIRSTSREEGVTRYPWSFEEKIGTIYYCTSLHFHTPALTVWGFCCVTRGLVLTVAGTLFSFVLTLCNIG